MADEFRSRFGKMATGMARVVTTTLRGIGTAVRARPGTTLAVVGGVFALHVFLPPLLLAVTRKPWTYFTFNPWLAQLPLISSAPLAMSLLVAAYFALVLSRRQPERLAGW